MVVLLCKTEFHICYYRNLTDKVVIVLKNFQCCFYAIQLPFRGFCINIAFQTKISRKAHFPVKKSALWHISQTPTTYHCLTSQRMISSFSCIGNCGVEMEYFLQECLRGDTSSRNMAFEKAVYIKIETVILSL